ncbi:MAG: cysteine-rich small domain-containing protein [Clostridia bacterium]|nr:cysteine-rich small domain-containing protein [Clostridia bacterium]
MTGNSRFFSNTGCEYFPCHKGADPENFNCMFCFCPLYALGEECGGDFTYTEGGIKDCSQCLIPHSREGYEHVIAGFAGIAAVSGAGKPSK